MDTNSGSKMLAPLIILQILQRESDSNHKISQEKIIKVLEKDYNIVIERKTVHRHLLDLQAANVPIEFGRSGCYFDENERHFTDGELRLLIDSVLFSKHIPQDYANNLIDKLRDLAPISFREHSVCRAESIDSRTDNKEVFLNVEQLGCAIADHKQVRLVCMHYDVRGKLVADGEAHVVCPLKLFTYANHYYLYAKDEDGQDVCLRVEKLSCIEVLNKQSKFSASNQDVNAYLTSHPFMFGGEAEHARIRLAKEKIDDFIDAFGNKFACDKETSGTVELSLSASPQNLLVWAMQNCMFVEVLEPQSVRDALRFTATALRLKYENTDEDVYSNAIIRAKQDGVLAFSHCDLHKKRLHYNLTHCTKVVLNDVSAANLDFLEGFDDLRTLSLINVDVQTLNMIAGKSHLHTLTLVDTPIKDLSVLATLPELRCLVLMNNKNVKDYSVLYDLHRLNHLEVDESVPLERALDGVDVRVGMASRLALGVEGLAFSLRSPQRLLTRIFNEGGRRRIPIPPVCSERATREFDSFLAKLLTDEQICLLKKNLSDMIPLSVLAKTRDLKEEYVQEQIDKALKKLRLPENKMKIEQIFFGGIG